MCTRRHGVAPSNPTSAQTPHGAAGNGKGIAQRHPHLLALGDFGQALAFRCAEHCSGHELLYCERRRGAVAARADVELVLGDSLADDRWAAGLAGAAALQNAVEHRLMCFARRHRPFSALPQLFGAVLRACLVICRPGTSFSVPCQRTNAHPQRRANIATLKSSTTKP